MCHNCNIAWCTVCRAHSSSIHTVHNEKLHYLLMCSLVHSLYYGTTTPFKFGGCFRMLIAVMFLMVFPVIIFIVCFKVFAVLAIVYYVVFSIMQYFLMISKIIILYKNQNSKKKFIKTL